MNPVIAVIGCGSVGMRHVEALGRLPGPARILAVDINPEASRRACELFAKAKEETGGRAEVEPLVATAALPATIDLAIVATMSHHRLAAIRELLTRRRVRWMILEKFLFPRRTEYAEATAHLREACEAAWVNCSRRVYPAYQDIARRVANSSFIDMRVSGPAKAVPIGAIAIHFADLLVMLGGCRESKLQVNVVNVELLPTRRGVQDFCGVLEAVTADGRHRLRYEARVSGDAPLTVFIEASDARYIVHEWCEAVHFAGPDTAWRLEQGPFAVPLQSRLTNRVVLDLLTTGHCGLTPYDESVAIHLSILDALLAAYRRLTGDTTVDSVPFT